MLKTLDRLRPGTYLYAAGTIGAGVVDLIWGDFEAAHQPIQALGDHIPGRELLAYIAGIWLVLAGAAMLWRRTARAGAWAAGAIYLIFAAFWLPRFYTAPRVVGLRIPLLIGLLAGVAQQLILVAAAGILHATPATRESPSLASGRLLIRWTFGLSSIVFGLAHLTGIRDVAAMVPTWLPFGGGFWTILTGIAFVLAGVAILARILDVQAARLLAVMLAIFSVLVLAPRAASRRNQVPWGSNAYNLAAVGAVWMFAESVAAARPRSKA